jgi:hypothetical protein
MLIMLSFSSHVHDDELGKFRRRSLVQYVDRNIHLKQAAAPIAVLGIQQMPKSVDPYGSGGLLVIPDFCI